MRWMLNKREKEHLALYNQYNENLYRELRQEFYLAY